MELAGLAVVVLLGLVCAGAGYPNGGAKTPPLGWSGYQALMQGSGHCSNATAGLYNDATFRENMELLVSTGLAAKGYTTILADDCWIAETRDPATGQLRADPGRFPHGMAPLIDFAAQRSMRFGLYAAAGKETCRNFPGSLGHEALDAHTFASWGAAYAKLDACGDAPLGASAWQPQYQAWSKALAKQNHTMAFSCSWPAYFDGCDARHGTDCGASPWAPSPDKTNVGAICQLWRYGADSDPSWTSVLGIINYAAEHNMSRLVDTGPGLWNDADFVSVGCPTNKSCGALKSAPMTEAEQRSQFSLWCILASPIIIGSDLRHAEPFAFDILGNTAALAISQDVGGVQGWRVEDGPEHQVWVRPLGADARKDRHATSGSLAVAVALLNTASAPSTGLILDFAHHLGWPVASTASVLNVWLGNTTRVTGALTLPAGPHSTVFLRVSRAS